MTKKATKKKTRKAGKTQPTLNALVWKYDVNLDTAVGKISLAPQSGTPPLVGSVIQVPNGENPEIHLLRPAGETWKFVEIVFTIFLNPGNAVTVRPLSPSSGTKVIYNVATPPYAFDLKLHELAEDKIRLSNDNQVGMNPPVDATMGFRLTIEDDGLVYVSQDPQILDDPNG